MNLIDRLILAVYSFFLTLISIAVILASFNLIPSDKFWLGIDGRWEAAVIAALFLIVSLRFLFSGLSGRTDRTILVKSASLGEIKITAKAVENLVQKTARELAGIKDVKARLNAGNDNVDIYLNVSIMPDIPVPQLSEDLQIVVKERIQEITGVAVTSVKVNVENLTNESKQRSSIH